MFVVVVFFLFFFLLLKISKLCEAEIVSQHDSYFTVSALTENSSSCSLSALGTLSPKVVLGLSIFKKLLKTRLVKPFS